MQSISRGTESQVFRDHAAGIRMRTRSSSAGINAIGDKNRSAATWDCMAIGDTPSGTASQPIAAEITAPTGLSEISFFGWLVAVVMEVELSFFGEND